MNTGALLLVAVLGAGFGASSQTDEPPVVATETLLVAYQPEHELARPLILDRLEPATVLTIRASGYDSDTTGAVAQCVYDGARQCRNDLAVRFDDRGIATFQYLVTDDIGSLAGSGEACRLRDARCTIELSVDDKRSVVHTVFVDEAPPPGRVQVSPSRGLLVGDTVAVTATGFPADAELTVLVCAVPATSGPGCEALEPEVPLTIGPDGTAGSDITLDAAEVGSDGVGCGRRVTCQIVVTSDDSRVRAPAVTLSFAAGPGADYATARVVLGLTAAVTLALLAGWLIRSTEWNPPSESDSTPIDDAEFADLDLEAAEFDEPEPVASP